MKATLLIPPTVPRNRTVSVVCFAAQCHGVTEYTGIPRQQRLSRDLEHTHTHTHVPSVGSHCVFGMRNTQPSTGFVQLPAKVLIHKWVTLMASL